MTSQERRHVRARIDRLLHKADIDTLLKTEDFLKDNMVEVLPSKNPTGRKIAGPCATCRRDRPPMPNCQPWHLRKGRDGWIPRGALCQPCEWAGDSGKDLAEWPWWATWRKLKAEALEHGKPLLIKIPPADGKAPKRARSR